MGAELEIIVKTTGACNARCLYCSAGSSPAGEGKLAIETARALCDQAGQLLDAGRFARVRFLWHGGEPLLLGKRFFRELLSLGRPGVFRHNVQTNLTLLDNDWIDILEPLIGRDGIGTSMDPFDDVRRLGDGDHDGYRRRWLKGIELLDAAGWRVGCVYVLHRQGLERARALYWFFRNLRDGSSLSLRVNPLLQVGRAQDAACEHLALRPGEYGDFLIELARVWLADHRRLVLSPLKDFVRAWEGDGPVRSCDLAGRAGCMDSHLGIDPAGNVYNCGRAVDAGGMRFGHLKDVSLADCLDHPSRQVLREREEALLEGRCGNCPDWRLCHGGCPYESHTASEQAHQPTRLCEDYQRLFRWLERELGPARKENRRGQVPEKEPRPRFVPTSGRRADVEADRPRPAPQADRIVLDQAPGAVGQELVARLVSSGGWIWVGPDVPGGGEEAVRALTAAGVAVVIDRPKAWEEGALTALAEFFLRSPDLEVPVEPFYSALSYLLPAGPGRQAWALRSLYGKRPGRRDYGTHVALPCATCEAFKCCRGFWLDADPDPAHCREWRSIIARLAAAVRAHRSCDARLNSTD